MFVWVDKKYIIYFIENVLILIYIIYDNGTSHDVEKNGTMKRSKYYDKQRVIPTVIKAFFFKSSIAV